MKITCSRCGSTLIQMGGSMDTTGKNCTQLVKPCHVCIGDAEQRGFENGQKAEREHLDAVANER